MLARVIRNTSWDLENQKQTFDLELDGKVSGMLYASYFLYKVLLRNNRKIRQISPLQYVFKLKVRIKEFSGVANNLSYQIFSYFFKELSLLMSRQNYERSPLFEFLE